MFLLTAFLGSSRSGAGLGVPLAASLAGLVLLYLLALILARGAVKRDTPFLLVLLLGLMMRAPLIVAPPILSDDIYRYVWDGRVQAAGVNPFRYAPAAPELEALRDPDWQKINNRDLPTIYPPVAQAAFHFMARVLPGVAPLKALFALLDLLVLLVLRRTMGQRPGQNWRLLLYWWHPLPMLEFAWSGHVDGLGILCLLLAFVTATGPGIRCTLWAGGFLAAATLVKFPAALAAPFLPVRRRAPAVLAFLGLAGLLYLPYMASGVNVLGSLNTYVARWRSNDVLFGLLLRPGTAVDQPMRLMEAKLYLAALVSGVVVLVLLLRPHPARAILCVMGVAILFSPTVHPWYLTWLLPWIVLRFSPAFLYLTLAAFVGYHPLPGYLAGHGWHESVMVKVLALIPFAALLVWEMRRGPFGSRGESAGDGGSEPGAPSEA